MKLSDVRISNITELQTFLTENNVPFETDANKPRLQEIARVFIEARDAAKDAAKDTDVVTPPVVDQDAGQPKATVVVNAADAKEKEAKDAAAGEANLETEKEKKRLQSALVAKQKKEKDDQEEADKKKKAAKVGIPDEVGVPGARRDAALQDLLAELAKKGFENKQQLADLLEAEVRERKSLEAAKADHDAREAKIAEEEITLQRRIAASEKEFKEIHVHRKQCEEMLGKAVAIQEKFKNLNI